MISWILWLINAICLARLAAQSFGGLKFGFQIIAPYLERCFWIASTIPLSWFPLLIIKARWPAYRTSLGIEGILLIVLVASLWRLLSLSRLRSFRMIYTCLLGAVMFTGAMLGNRTALRFSEPLSFELRYVMSAIEHAHMDQVKLITIVRPTYLTGAAYDELGVPASSILWSYQGLVFFAMRQLNIQPAQDLKISWATPEEIKQLDAHPTDIPGRLLIDMRIINDLYKWRIKF